MSVDRESEIPIGVQLAWALRARISDGTFGAGQRLPGLRELAEATDVNVNTVRTVYQRLDQEGLIDSQQGSGTFVAAEPPSRSDISMLAAHAARDARELGVDPREVAAALYVAPPGAPNRLEAAAQRRRVLRRQISALEMALGEIEAQHPGLLPPPTQRKRAARGGPQLLDVDGLARVRTQQLERLTALQQAIETQSKAAAPPPRSNRGDSEKAKSKRTAKAPAIPRAAPANS